MQLVLLSALLFAGWASASDVCSLPKQTGRCRAYIPRFYFNSESGKCEQFIYGGCDANANNFKTQDECEAKCPSREKRSVRVCQMPADSGPCRASMPRVFFNHKTGQCENFIYGGCNGNENNFGTVKECEDSCLMRKREANVCSLPAVTGPCRAYFPRYFFNGKSGKCEQFVYGGCAGNENNFETKEACEGQCSKKTKRNGGVAVCRLPAEPGNCRAAIPRVFFNHKTGQCENFIYGGCQGNENNFGSVKECEDSCLMRKRREVEDVCSLPSVTGPCKALFRRFFFNSKSGKCERFIYGGCRGNGNNFNSQEDCEQRCSSSKAKRNGGVAVCRLPAEPGNCRAAIPRVFFNHKTGQCEKFIYGGCQGNENNFGSVKECEDSCLMRKREVEDVCTLPAVTGPCRAAFRRFFYNSKSGHCEQFIYGGCRGNENNFESPSVCEQRCGTGKAKRSFATEVCRLNADAGPCRASMPRYFFNHKTGLCEKFTYGGCQGNKNNFGSLRECENSCLMKKREANVCSLPKEVGPCRAAFPRVFFNSQTGKCENFIYGGCGGNENNFTTEEQCEQACQ